jgi:hypothetical protein
MERSMPDHMTRYAVHAAGELGLQDITVERCTKHMRLTAHNMFGDLVMVGYSEPPGDWRAAPSDPRRRPCR